MSGANFIDYIKFCSRSGAGGSGAVHFRREKHVPKGGPDGGNGGRGGHIILKGNPQLWTLLHLKYKKHVIAARGGQGGGSRSTGHNGEDIVLEVPLGTVAYSADTGKKRFEITRPGEEQILTCGGRGGLGNAHFKSATSQTPRFAQPGEPGKEEWIVLELKVLADVGLVGFPNAGKSTLLSVLSAAKPEIADYPFTTLVPNLGVVAGRDYQSFVMADIPGIIEGASQGKGLGTRFLRHIERNAILLFVIAADSDDVVKAYNTLLTELQTYNPEMSDKERILAISKSDLTDDERNAEIAALLPPQVETCFISSVTGKGLTALKDLVWKKLNKSR